jgi:hypothetical protein
VAGGDQVARGVPSLDTAQYAARSCRTSRTGTCTRAEPALQEAVEERVVVAELRQFEPLAPAAPKLWVEQVSHVLPFQGLIEELM